MGASPAVRNKKALRSSVHLVAMSLVSFGIGFLMSYDAATVNNSLGNPGMRKERLGDAATTQDAQYAFPSTTLELLGTILMKHRQLYSNIRSEYGRFSTIFSTESLERIFQQSPLSRKRLIRKLMIKILLGRIHNKKGVSKDGEPVFHWVTAGDSATAGHGNSPAYSYTSILEDTVGDLFKSTGINFVATNQAGDAWSGMELALCMETIFGRDVDVLSWDFMSSTADANSGPLSPLLFGERAGQVLPHLPFIFFLGLFADGGARETLEKLETSGIGIGIMGGEELRELILSFPNYNNERGRRAPEAINKFRCGESIEGKDSPAGGVDCDKQIKTVVVDAKYHAGESCSNDRYQTPWNDGWKMHRLKGRLLGFHLIQMLHLAAIELDIFERQHPELNINDALGALREEEEVEEFLFAKTRPSRLDNERSTSWNILKQKNAVCLNAKVASTGPPNGLRKFELDPPQEALCEDFVPFQNVYFRVTEADGWVSMDPLAQSHDRIAEKGPLAATDTSFGLCFKQQAPDEQRINWSKVVIRLNGNLVSGLKPVGGCYLLEGEEGVVWKNEALGSGMKIQNHGEEALSVSSSFILY